MNIRLSTLFCAIILFTHSVSAFNHPEIKWRSVVTDHFIIHFYDRTEPAVYAAWKIAEQAYESLSNLYDFSERGKINIALADYDDYSNGFASWTNESIMIWITDARFDLRGDNTWLRNVITHELTHIVTLEKRSKLQLLDWSFNLSYQSPHAAIALSIPTATSMFWPSWFAEGMAQRESQRAGNDSWDSRRDMLLRDAILFSTPLSLAEMGNFNHNSIGNELVYNQGFSFIHFLEEKLGFQRIKDLYNDGRSTTLFVQNFMSYFQEHTGQSLEQLYEEWLLSLKTSYDKKTPADPTPLTVVWDKGFLNAMPKVSRDKRLIGWLTNDRDDYDRTDLLIAPYGSLDKARRVSWAKQSWDFSPDGKKVYFVKSHTPNEFGSYVNDIFELDLTTNSERRLVKNARAYDLAISPDNRSLAWIQYREGSFSIVRSGIDGRDRSTVIQGKIGEPLWYLSFNPGDPNQLATTRVIDGKARLCVVDIDQRSITPVTTAMAQEETPFWSDNGRIYYSADYDGVSTIYSINPDNGDCQQHAVTAGGLFSPVLVDNATMLCCEYRNKGFRIVSCPAPLEEPYDPPDSSGSSFKPLPSPRGKVTIRSYPYEPKLLRPAWELQTGVGVIDKYGKMENMQDKALFRNFMDSMSYFISTAIVMSQSDALEKQSKWMGIEGMVEIDGIARDTVNHFTHSGSVALDPNAVTHVREILNPRGGAPARGKKGFLSDESVMSITRTYAAYKGALENTHSSSTTDSVRKTTTTAVLIPGMGWQSAAHTITYGLNVQGFFVSGIIPAIISASGQAQWQILRDLYIDFNPQLQFSPLTLFSGYFIGMSSWPLSLAWSTSGYMNTDIQYNMSDLTLVQGTVIPSFFPFGNTEITQNGRDSTVYHSGSSMSYDLQCIRGFPLTRYSSLVAGVEAMFTSYSEHIDDPLDTLTIPSDIYSTAALSTEYIFPIARQINRGEPYADALYGSLLYTATLYSNSQITDKSFRQALSYSSYDTKRFFVEHSIGASLKLGMTKSYMFPGVTSLKVLWDVWGKRLSFNLTAFL